MITRMEIEGFRSFRDAAFDLSPFTVLVGPNGSGKTNLLEAVDLVAQISRDAAEGTWGGDEDSLFFFTDLRPGDERRGRVLDLFHRVGDGSTAGRFRLALCFLQSHREGLSHLRLELRAELGDRRSPGVMGRITLLPDAPADWELTPVQRREIAESARRGPSLFHNLPGGRWRWLVPEPARMRTPADLVDDRQLAPDAHNLAAVLGRLFTDPDRDRHRELLLRADAAAVLPGLVDLRPTPDPDSGVWELDLVYRDAPAVPVRLASYGTLHVLALLTAAHAGLVDPHRHTTSRGRGSDRFNRCSTLMIEDVENGLHPALVRELVHRLRRCTGDGRTQQLIVTTHSPVVLSAVYDDHPSDVFFVDTVSRVGGGGTPSRHSRVRSLAESGPRGTYVPAREARRYLESAVASGA
ncbi:AAA family ATPase [Streptomyces sp. NPDC003401]